MARSGELLTSLDRDNSTAVGSCPTLPPTFTPRRDACSFLRICALRTRLGFARLSWLCPCPHRPPGVFAQGEEPQITAAADVITTSLFPRFPNKGAALPSPSRPNPLEIPLGHVTEVLLNFKNTGRHTYNVTAIRGFLMFPNDQVNFLQNVRPPFTPPALSSPLLFLDISPSLYNTQRLMLVFCLPLRPDRPPRLRDLFLLPLLPRRASRGARLCLLRRRSLSR